MGLVLYPFYFTEKPEQRIDSPLPQEIKFMQYKDLSLKENFAYKIAYKKT